MMFIMNCATLGFRKLVVAVQVESLDAFRLLLDGTGLEFQISKPKVQTEQPATSIKY